MDPDVNKQLNEIRIKILKQSFNSLPNAGDVFQSTWLRRAFQTSNGLDRILLDYGLNFLPSVGILSWCLFLLEKVF